MGGLNKAVQVAFLLLLVSNVDAVAKTKCKVKHEVSSVPQTTATPMPFKGFVAAGAIPTTSVVTLPAPIPQKPVEPVVLPIIPRSTVAQAAPIPIPTTVNQLEIIPKEEDPNLEVFENSENSDVNEGDTQSLESSMDDTPAPAPAPQVENDEPLLPSPPSPPSPPFIHQAESSGKSITQLISESSFNQALETCGIPAKPGLYQGLTNGFTAPLDGGMKELALLIGNTAHESGSYKHTEEINCKGVTTVTPLCAYGWYHGRGYIQLSWESNYASAAKALGIPAILSTPDIVMNDEKVNWAVVQWYWVSTVQPYMREHGYTLGNSVKSINGYIECGAGRISEQRVKFVQCFQRQFLGSSADATYC
ncbi:lysozyme-like domain-containing protein [Obelidium mucronatum]|nr:lysozyme-like domain-containing protein [Obelidium mucronatum]